MFDFVFSERPRRLTERRDDRWGGYRVEFKLLPSPRASVAKSNLPLARRSAVEIDSDHSRVFRVEISKYEYCAEKIARDLDDYRVYVYPPFLLAAEKLRALCQQMPEYVGRRKPTRRARDFFDIHSVISDPAYVQPRGFSETVAKVFAAKKVPLMLIDRLGDTRGFHATDWPAVQSAAPGITEPFGFYFDFVVRWAGLIKSQPE